MEELKMLNQLINDFWKLIKATYDQPAGEEQNNQYWTDLFAQAHALASVHGGHGLAKHLLMAYLDYQEGVYRERKKNA